MGRAFVLVGVRLVRLPEGLTRINQTNFGFLEFETDRSTEVFGFGVFGFGVGYFGSENRFSGYMPSPSC